MKSLEDHAWGRLLKVLYIVAFPVIIIFAIFIFGEVSRTYHPAETKDIAEWIKGGKQGSSIIKEAYYTYDYKTGAIAGISYLIGILITLELVRIAITYILGYRTQGFWGWLLSKLR